MTQAPSRLVFQGAAGNVTGARYFLESGNTRLLVDCGLFQERDLQARNWEPFPIPPKSLNAVLLTHAHVDHCGLLPRLARQGFAGPVYCTPATSEIAALVLMDAAKLQVEDAAHKKKRHEREGRSGPYPEEPLFTEKEAETALRQFSPVQYGQTFQVGDGVEGRLYDAGHILGSSMIRLTLASNGAARTVLFSGDLGRVGAPILRDPEIVESADYVVMESTYGNRVHPACESIPDALARIIRETREANGNLVIPSFAVERTQEILYYLNGLLWENRIPHLMVFVDSPMAARVTEIMRQHLELMDEEARKLILAGRHPCDFPGLHFSTTVEQSKAINHIRGTAIIIAGSGMCTGGRIKYHLAANIARSESAILFVGYQATGTLGRIILDGAPEVRIHGITYPTRARVAQIHGFSAHADRDELLRWVSGLKQAPRQVFVTHGEREAAAEFARLVETRLGWPASAPAGGEETILD
ncbi:MAG: MBL fold metallo-hydrolase [Verrucomicrobiota bacterium]|nr:MBL fold metallo-hydrolase [Verrucomicrobiota bacterium]